MLLSDRPIVCAAEDQLGFQPFSATLAKGLRDMAPAEGMVVALHAAWGSGKTSALNLIEQSLSRFRHRRYHRKVSCRNRIFGSRTI